MALTGSGADAEKPKSCVGRDTNKYTCGVVACPKLWRSLQLLTQHTPVVLVGCPPTHPCIQQAGAGHSLSAVQRMSVWFMSLISAGIAVASVVVNDYFDLKVDAQNAPDKPLPSGVCLCAQQQQCVGTA